MFNDLRLETERAAKCLLLVPAMVYATIDRLLERIDNIDKAPAKQTS